MKNGVLVWAKIREECSGTCYWPGLIQTRDSHGVSVSFFNHQTPRYLHPTEICPFSENPLPTELDGACDTLLDSALRWLCRRTARSLRCQCRSETTAAAAAAAAAEEMVIGGGEAFEAKKSFRPEAVLGFVKSNAVWAWVEIGDFVEAIKSVAEIQVFRDYNTIDQKSAYRKGRRARRRHDQRGTHVELPAHPSSDSVASESYNLELDFECHASPKPEEKKMKAGVASIMDATILLSKESVQPMLEDQLEKQLMKVQKQEEQSLYEMLVNLRCLALDSFCLEANRLNATKQNLFGFRSILLEIQNSGALISSPESNTCLLDFSHNIYDFSRFKDSPYLGKIIEISEDQEHNGKDSCRSYVKLQVPDRSTRETCLYMKVDNCSGLLEPSATQLSISKIYGTTASDVEKVDDAATEVSRSESRLISDKSQMQASGDKGAISVESNGKAVSLNVASEDRVEKIKKLNNSCSSGLLLNLHEDQQSKALARFADSKSLHMKFPKGYNLPSKEELVRKFRLFGPIDSLKTKIFNYTGSAQLVFFNQSDAMVAYQNAKRKKLLPGNPNVRYWLDPFESKRGGAKFMAVKPLEPKLKSCLRNYDSLGTEGKRKHQKVRFLMVTES